MTKWGEEGINENSKRYFYNIDNELKEIYYFPSWVGHYHCDSPYNKKRKNYPDFLIAYICSGNFYLEYKNTKNILIEGDAFLIDCESPHYYRALDEGLEFIFLHFNGSDSHAIVNHIIERKGHIFKGNKAKLVGEMLFDLVGKCKKNGSVLNLKQFSLFAYNLLLSLIDGSNDYVIIEERVVQQSIKYMYENLNVPFDLKDLADHVNLSKYYFSHKFKSEMNYAPMEYLKNIRIETAKRLLINSETTVKEIGQLTGYLNQNSFSKIFSKSVGLSPSAYREKQKTQ